MVKGGDSQTTGCKFESECQMLDGLFTIYLFQKLFCLFEKAKSRRKRDWDGPTSFADRCLQKCYRRARPVFLTDYLEPSK